MTNVPSANGAAPALDLDRVLGGKRLVVIGGTGFLGKVFWAFVLDRVPSLERMWLVVRPKGGQTADERFWNDIATSRVLDPLRERHGPRFEAWLAERVIPIAGDVVHPFCGLASELREDLRGRIDAVVNASGVVDFDPPLDEALEVNAFGVQNLVALARDLGEVPLLHTSTCFVAGDRTGIIEEVDPREHPFPRAGELSQAHWEPGREIAECLDVIEQARHRANDAFRQSRFLDDAKRNLRERGEPGTGAVLEAEVEKVRRKFVEAQLSDMGMERAMFWGFPNTYTYTKAIGEQIVAASGLRFTVVRPAIVESTVAFPFPGWNEGINTSAPLIYSLREGQPQIPGSDHYLDIIPCDMVAGGMLLSLAELLEGRAPPVYQYGTSDTNPFTMRRAFELSGLYKRRYFRETGRGGPILSQLHARWESSMLGEEAFEKWGPRRISEGARAASRWLGALPAGPARVLVRPAAKALAGFAEQQRRMGDVLGAFVPFTARYHYIFRCDATRAAAARLSPEDHARIGWEPERIDWRRYWFEVHVPGLERWVFPEIDKLLRRERKPPARHETLGALLVEMAERHGLAVALQRTEAHGLSRLSFVDWLARARACATRLREAGVVPGARVLLAGANHPAWAIAFFGVQLAGATAVPLEAEVEAAVAENLRRASGARVFLADTKVRDRVRPGLGEAVTWLDLIEASAPGPAGDDAPASSRDVAALIYTSGTTGSPKGVMLTHENLTALVAALAPLFPLGKGDRVLSVLPLHHTFELTCGMLLPLSRGARIVYLDELSAERLEHALQEGRITAMVGVPALWEMLERRISTRVAEHGRLASSVFDFAVELSRSVGGTTGLDLGKLLFGPVHQALGGHLRFLVSGGAALPERTHRVFSGLGLHLAEGYGLTEASPVLSVAEGGPRARPGHVGRAVPGVELQIHEPNAEGVGRIRARGPNVMLGYADDEDATRLVLDADGWLDTGDLGRIDRKGNLVIAGRAKDVVVAANGENIYPDDVEARLGEVEHLRELAIVGIGDARGGERVACVAVVAPDDALPRAERHVRARRSLERRLATLPASQRPAVLTLVDAALPRTATRKVKRNEVRRLVERVGVLSERPPVAASGALDPAAQRVRSAVAVITRREPSTLRGEHSLRGDLGFDSLMLLELLVALEGQVGGTLDAERLTACLTIGDAEALLREQGAARLRAPTTVVEEAEETPLEIPPALRDAAMEWLGRAQMGFYGNVLHVKVSGRAFLPHNRNTLVAANHASHLDMGLVKYALGSYGSDIVALAAQDYFFEGNRWRKAYFENFTNVIAFSRQGSLRQSLRQASNLITEGKTVLIFPEGTRMDDGEVHEFKPAVGHLALSAGADVLPVWLGGTHLALPKGALVLRRRDVTARIGPPLLHADLVRLTRDLGRTEASRAVARLVRRAVVELSRGRVLDASRLEPGDLREDQRPETLDGVFRELQTRFVPGAIDRAVSFYFALGDRERWSVRVDATGCEVRAGKAAATADCVLKTSPGMFTRIVREAYTPTPAEFVTGTVKTNDIGLLVTFQKVFNLVGDA
ncbi:MAG: AMP-binding protein [Polyangiaceae bacterium]|nr:AMP-binding protein [Polyangiaceae bacterium]